MNSTQKHITLGVVTKGDEVLLVRRKNLEQGVGSEVLSWAFPGGKIEDGELAEESVVREVLEETGYSVEVALIIDEGQHPSFPVYASYFACRLTKNRPDQVSDTAIAECKWVPVVEIENYLTSRVNDKVASFLKLNAS